MAPRALVFVALSSLFLLVACEQSKSPPIELGGKLAEDGISPPEQGELVPDFELQARDGQTYRLSDFEGSYVFLNFWATWCPPCIEELPSMDHLNQRLKARNFVMIAVSVDESWEEIDQFLARLNREPSFLVLLDAEKVVATEQYGTEKFPETYLISPQRRLLKKYPGAYDWTEASIFSEITDFLD